MAIIRNHSLTAIRNFMAIKSNSPSKTTPLYQGSLLRRGLKQRLKDFPGYEVDAVYNQLSYLRKKNIYSFKFDFGMWTAQIMQKDLV